MKISNYLIIVLSAALISCSEDFIDIAPESELSVANFFQDAGDVEQAVIGVYDALQANGQYGYNFPYFMEIRSDNSTIQDLGRGNFRYGDFETFELDVSNIVVDQSWKACYNGIQRCNVVLNRIGDIDMNQTIKDQRIAEVKFIRALTYFNMVRIWGGLPLVTNEVKDPFEAFGRGRASVNDIYAQIINDLTDALDGGLPDVDPSGRVTEVAVRTLLGKVYLTRQQYTLAESMLQSVVDKGSHSLLADINEVFDIDNANNAESIFEIQFVEDQNEGSSFANLFAPSGADDLIGNVGSTVGDNIPTESLVSLYDSTDARLVASIGQVVTASDDTSYYSRKFTDVPSINFNSDRNFIVLRYADVLLMLAEAINEGGYAAGGAPFDYLNQVRTRAGLPAYDAATLGDQTSFRNAVLEERRLELALENHRWFDLVRTGTAINTMAQQGFTIANHQLLYPIPQNEININPTGLTQNPGY